MAEVLIDRLDIHPGVFIRRVSRVSAYVWGGDRVWYAHLTNTGKLLDLLVGGRVVWCLPRRGVRTDCRLVGVPVSLCRGALIDTFWQERIVMEVFRRGLLRDLRGWEVVSRAPRVGGHRLDLRCRYRGEEWYVEIKSAVYYFPEDGSARYPDTVTERGRSHLRLLGALFRRGVKVILVFVAAHPFARRFVPHDADPEIPRLVCELRALGLPMVAIKMYLDAWGGVWVEEEPLSVDCL